MCRRRHQPRRPPHAKIRPGRPAPATGAGTVAGATNAMTAVVAIPRPPVVGVVQALRANKFDAIFMQRTRKGRNGRIAMRHATKTTNIRPSIPRMRKKRGESWSTNKAGTAVTIARKVSPIQSSIFSIQSSQRFSRNYISEELGEAVGTGRRCLTPRVWDKFSKRPS